ncbi:MAG TPA: class I SAM-dependent methyltransferase [Terrimicrobiaceae bacterium]
MSKIEQEHSKPKNGTLRETHRPVSSAIRKGAIDISRAQKIDGFISDEELRWLAKAASKRRTIIEVGSWHGRSSRAIADNMPEGSILYCVDHWLGAETERDSYHRSAKLKDGDHAFIRFSENLFDHIQKGRVIALRMSSRNAAEFLRKQGITAEMVFIDAGHTYQEVKEDIDLWLPLMREGGTICGHDYYHENNMWPEVQQAVDERFGCRGMEYLENNSIWKHRVGKGTRAISKRSSLPPHRCLPSAGHVVHASSAGALPGSGR